MKVAAPKDLSQYLRDTEQAVRRLFQLADNPGRNEPGTGEINYDFLLPFIDGLGYNGWVGCEYRPKGKTVDGLGWARKWMA